MKAWLTLRRRFHPSKVNHHTNEHWRVKVSRTKKGRQISPIAPQSPPSSPLPLPSPAVTSTPVIIDKSSTDDTSADKDLEKSKEERSKLLFNAQLEEYKALRAELIVTVGFQHQIVNYVLLAVAALITGSDRIISAQLYYLYVVASFFFFALLYILLRYALTVQALGKYIGFALSDSILDTMNGIAPRVEKLTYHPFAWDGGMNAVSYTSPWLRLLEFSRYVVCLACAIVSYGAYVYYKYDFDNLTNSSLLIPHLRSVVRYASPVEWLLALLQLSLTFYAVVVGLRMRAGVGRSPKKSAA